MHYYRALADEAAGQHGHCLVRLGLSEQLAKEAITLAASFHSTASGYLSSSLLPSDATTSMQSLAKGHHATVAERREQAQKDNDLIYHDILPSENSLPAVEKLTAATPMALQQIYALPEVEKVIITPDPFAKLVPLQVHESASLYSEEKAKLARGETEQVDLANVELEAALSHLGLPAALSVFKNIGQSAGGDGLLDSLADPPSEVVHWSEELSGSGESGVQGVESSFRRLEQMRSEAGQSISQILGQLDDENRECEKARVRWGHEWTQEPSALRTRSMRSDLKAHRDALSEAGANDARIQQLWSSVRNDLATLSGGRPALERAFAEAVTRSGANASGASLLDLSEQEESMDERQVMEMQLLVSDIDTAVVKLNKIKRERTTTLTDMKDKIQKDDISQVLVINRRNSGAAPQIFAQELEKFKPYQQRIALCNDGQQRTLAELTSKWKQLNEGQLAKQLQRKFKDTEGARRKLVEQLRSARDAYGEVRNAVSKGLTFYNDLLEIVAAIRSNSENFVRERKAERERLVREREWEDKLKPGSGAVEDSFARSSSPPASSAASRPPPSTSLLAGAMSGMSLGSGGGPPPPPPPGQRSYSGNYPPPPQQSAPTSSYSSYSSPPPPPQAPPADPYGSMFSSGPFADRPPPQPPSAHSPYSPPPPPQPQYGQSSYSSAKPPQSPSYPQSPSSGLPPPPAQFQSSFYGSAPPPPPPQQQQQQHSYGSYGYGQGQPPLPPPPAQHQYGQYQQPPPPPPQQQQQQPYGGGQYQQYQRPAY